MSRDIADDELTGCGFGRLSLGGGPDSRPVGPAVTPGSDVNLTQKFARRGVDDGTCRSWACSTTNVHADSANGTDGAGSRRALRDRGGLVHGDAEGGDDPADVRASTSIAVLTPPSDAPRDPPSSRAEPVDRPTLARVGASLILSRRDLDFLLHE